MAEMKTKVNEASVEEFLSKVEDEQKRKDCFEIVKIMKQVTKKVYWADRLCTLLECVL